MHVQAFNIVIVHSCMTRVILLNSRHQALDSSVIDQVTHQCIMLSACSTAVTVQCN